MAAPQLWTLLLLLCCGIRAAWAEQKIVVIADSFSDNGNGYAQAVKESFNTRAVYPEQPYYSGRWSNGPTYIEYVANVLNLPLYDYAAAGATTGFAPAQVPPIQPPFANLTQPTTVLSPNLFQQINRHLRYDPLFNTSINGVLSPDDFYVVFIGANEYLAIALQNYNSTADVVIGNIRVGLDRLYTAGARRFLLINEPDLTGLPVFTQPFYRASYGQVLNLSLAYLKQQVTRHNALLNQTALTFNATHPGSTVQYFDVATKFTQLLGSARAMNFTNTAAACHRVLNIGQGAAFGPTCTNPDNYIFWDQFHPTARVHRILGEGVTAATARSFFGRNYSAPPPPAASQPPPRAGRPPPSAAGRRLLADMAAIGQQSA